MTLVEGKTIRCGYWSTVLRRDLPALLYHSAQFIKMLCGQALQVQGKYPHGLFFCGHVDPRCRRFLQSMAL